MPELPEVKQFTDYAKSTALKQEVEKVEVNNERILQADKKDFDKYVVGHSFISAEQRGKYLILALDNGSFIGLHFGMTGSLDYGKGEDRPDYSQVIFKFKNGYELRFVNKRKLGQLFLEAERIDIDSLGQMGPEPLTMSKQEFLDFLENNANRNIKALLMDQHKIAGIGNEYSDEILYQARVHPERQTGNLSDDERKEIYEQTQRVLKAASEMIIDEPFPDDWLQAHRHGDRFCPRHGDHQLTNRTIAGRSAYFCQKSQK